MDSWLKREANRFNKQGISNTYVWTLLDDPHVVAYYSLSTTLVRRGQLPRSASGGHSLVPGYLIGRFALDVSIQGQGYGSELLFDAIECIVAAMELVAGRLILVDAIDENAKSFYQHHGFNQIGDTDRLYLTATTAKKIVS
ncbi:MAG: GNAT family N-acetyltransferase [Propionibacteriaceae bacterium]|nr:GNAT family N-acetyltransferase [Propionibacteriaceae bacterium]